MRRLAQSTAYTVMLKLFLSSDHVSAATGKTVAIKISKAGGAFSDPNAGATNATEVSNGWYKVTLDTTDTNTLGDLVVRGTATSCDDAEQVCQVVSATTGGAANLDAAVSAVKNKTDSLTFTVAGMVDSNVVDWKGATAPAMTGDAYARLGAPAGASVSADIAAAKTDTAAIKSKTDSLNFTVSGQVDANVTNWKGSAAPAMTGDAYARIGAAGAGLTALGDTRIAHLDADISSRSTYAGADTSGTTTLLSRLTSTRAGLLDHLDADISSRMATFSYTAPDNASITAIKAKTDNLPSDPVDASDIAAAFSIVGTAITSLQSHGDSAWATATGFSTSADITAAVSAIEAYGDGAWVTATGFSTLDAADVSAAVWDVQLTDHVAGGSMGQSLFYAQQGATSADSKANDIYGDTQAIRGVTDGLVQTGGKLWVLDDQGNALRHSGEIASDFSTLTAHGDGAWGTADVSDLPTNAELATAIAGIPTAPTAAAIADEVETRTLDADIKKVNGVTVQGAGTSGNEWRPA